MSDSSRLSESRRDDVDEPIRFIDDLGPEPIRADPPPDLFIDDPGPELIVDDTNHQETIVQQRLAKSVARRSAGWWLSLRVAIVALAMSPILIWYGIQSWPSIKAIVAKLLTRSAASGPTGEPLFAESTLGPVIALSLLTGVLAFVLVRFSGRNHAGTVCLFIVGISVVIVVPSVFAALSAGLGGGFGPADSNDLFAVYAIPLGVTATLCAIGGWKVAEID